MADKGRNSEKSGSPTKFVRPADPICKKLTLEEEKKEIERTKREKECKELSIRYSLPTRMGEWLEAAQLTEEKCKDYEKRRDACLTFYQKQSMVYEHLFSPMSIAKYEQYLKYGIPIQIQSDYQMSLEEGKSKSALTLSVLISEIQIDSQNMLKLGPDSQVTVSYDKTRVRRNVFVIVGLKGQAANTTVMYGEDIFIRIFDSDGAELYLTGDVPGLDTFGQTKGKVPMGLTIRPDRFAKFRVVDPNKEKMVTLQGSPVPTFARIAMTQTITNLLLAVNLQDSITTLFSIDHPVVCFTYKDKQSRVSSENFWIFTTQSIDEGVGDIKEPGPSNQ